MDGAVEADADGDGQVTYQEIAGFVQRANASVQSERFRPDVFAHPATASGALIDLLRLARTEKLAELLIKIDPEGDLARLAKVA